MDEPLREGVDYYLEEGLFVLTREFLLRRGTCCQSGCRHCPYGWRPRAEGLDGAKMRDSETPAPPPKAE